MIKALLLDLDGTLLDDHAAMMKASAALFAAHRARLADRSFEEFLKRWREVSVRHWLRYVAGELDMAGQQRERMRALLGVSLSDAEADAAFAPHHAAYAQAWCCYEDVAAFLQATRGLPKIAVTNGDRRQQRAKMAATGLLGAIPELVTPGDAGVWKPEPGIFLHALRSLGVAPTEAVMIGDDYERDIVPAEKLGLRTFWVRRGVNDLSGALTQLIG